MIQNGVEIFNQVMYKNYFYKANLRSNYHVYAFISFRFCFPFFDYLFHLRSVLQHVIISYSVSLLFLSRDKCYDVVLAIRT